MYTSHICTILCRLATLISIVSKFQPQTLEDIAVDPVEDDIEIVDEGSTSDAFAVGACYILLRSFNPGDSTVVQ